MVESVRCLPSKWQELRLDPQYSWGKLGIGACVYKRKNIILYFF